MNNSLKCRRTNGRATKTMENKETERKKRGKCRTNNRKARKTKGKTRKTNGKTRKTNGKPRKTNGKQGANEENEGKPGKWRKTNGKTRKIKGKRFQTGKKNKTKKYKKRSEPLLMGRRYCSWSQTGQNWPQVCVNRLQDISKKTFKAFDWFCLMDSCCQMSAGQIQPSPLQIWARKSAMPLTQ